MTITRLSSGYWFARWSPEIWAQWPVGRDVDYEDFFHPAYSATPARIDACTRAVAEAERRTP